MKTLFFVFAILCIIQIQTQAQLLVGPRVGLHLSSVRYSDPEFKKLNQRQFTPGFNLGTVINLKITNIFSLHTELNYSRLGKAVVENKEQGVYHKAVYHFLDVPILVRACYYQRPELKFYFNAGPTLNYWLGGSGTLQTEKNAGYTGSYIIRFSERQDPFDTTEGTMYIPEPNRFQLGLNLGVGSVFDIGRKQKIMIDLRFVAGHTFLSDKGENLVDLGYYDDLRASNRAWAFSVAYLYEIDTKAFRKGKSTIK